MKQTGIRRQVSAGGVLAGLLAAAVPGRAQDAPLSDLPGFSRTSRLSARAEYARFERTIIEYDDRWLTVESLDVRGRCEQETLFVEVAYQIVPELELAARLGRADADVLDCSWAYDVSYGSGAACGIGIRSRLDMLWEYGVALKLSFDMDWAEPADGQMPHGSRLITLRPSVEAWELGLAAEWKRDRVGWMAGARYSDFVMTYEHDSDRVPGGVRVGGFEATNPFGLFAAASFAVMPVLEVSLRVDAIDRTGFALGMTCLF